MATHSEDLVLQEITRDMANQPVKWQDLSEGEQSDIRRKLPDAGRTILLRDFLALRERVHPAHPVDLAKYRLCRKPLAEEIANGDVLHTNHAFGLFRRDEKGGILSRPEIVVYTSLAETAARAADGALNPACLPGDIEALRANEKPRVSNPDTIVFYSISKMSNLKTELGQNLIYRLASALSGKTNEPGIPAMTGLQTFCTLSPVPGFNGWLRDLLMKKEDQFILSKEDRDLIDLNFRNEMIDDEKDEKKGKKICLVPKFGMSVLPDSVHELFEKLCLQYLNTASIHSNGLGAVTFPALNSVARFHASNNGATLAQIHPFSDNSPQGIINGAGCMVNYVYDLGRAKEQSHRAKHLGTIPMTPQLKEKWNSLKALQSCDLSRHYGGKAAR